MSQLFYYAPGNSIVWHTYTYCIFFCLQYFRHILACFQDEGIRSRKVLLQGPVYSSCQLFGILAQVTKIITHKGQIGLLWLHTLYLADSFYSLVLVYIAPQSIDSICRIYNNTSIFQYLNYLAYQSFRWIFRMNMYKHTIEIKVKLK